MNNKSRLSRKNYSARTISIFEVIGSYFVDTFYNHLHATSQKNHEMRASNGKNRSLTDEYKFTLETYLKGISNDHKYYEKAIKGVLEAYRTHTKYTTISMLDFINEILQHYLPEEHFTILNTEQKFFFLNKIITQLVKAVITEITQIQYMRMVIDDHANEQNVRLWMEIVVDMQIMIRETLFNEFIKQERGSTNGRDISETVDVEVVRKIVDSRNKLWEEVQSLLKQKCELEVELSRAKKIVEVLYAKVQSMPNTNALEKASDDAESSARKKILSTHVSVEKRQDKLPAATNSNKYATELGKNASKESAKNKKQVHEERVNAKKVINEDTEMDQSDQSDSGSSSDDDSGSSSEDNNNKVESDNDNDNETGVGDFGNDFSDDDTNDVLSSALKRMESAGGSRKTPGTKKGVRERPKHSLDDLID